MSLPKFHGSKVNEDPIDFIDEAHPFVVELVVPSEEKVELVSYQLKGLAKNMV